MTKHSPILIALDAIKEWFHSAVPNRHLNDEQYQQAITALYTALNETKIYIGSLNRSVFDTQLNNGQFGSPRDDETEARLSRLWTTASLKIRPFDHDLADRCLLKSSYWAERYKWSAEDVKEARIQIDLVFQDARRLL